MSIERSLAVVVPTVGGRKSLNEAIRSVGYSSIEPQILVVFSGSGAQVSCLDKSGIRLESRMGPSGANAARNFGIEEVDADWILLLDDDDQFTEGHIDRVSALISDQPELIGVVSPVLFRCRGFSRIRGASKPPEKRGLLLNNSWGGCSSMVFRKDAWEAIGRFDEGFESMQDWDFWIRLTEYGKVGWMENPGVVYSAHDGPRITNDLQAKYRGLRRLFFKHRLFFDPVASFHLHRLCALKSLLNPQRFGLFLFCSICSWRHPFASMNYFRWRRWR